MKVKYYATGSDTETKNFFTVTTFNPDILYK